MDHHRSADRGRGNDRRRDGGRRDAPPPGPAKGAPPPAAKAAPAGAEVEVDTRRPLVGVVMGSDSDLPVVQHCLETLEEFDIPYEVRVISAHRTPD
jgi:hypothetical protein